MVKFYIIRMILCRMSYSWLSGTQWEVDMKISVSEESDEKKFKIIAGPENHLKSWGIHGSVQYTERMARLCRGLLVNCNSLVNDMTVTLTENLQRSQNDCILIVIYLRLEDFIGLIKTLLDILLSVDSIIFGSWLQQFISQEKKKGYFGEGLF